MINCPKDELYYLPIKAPLPPQAYMSYANKVSPEKRNQLYQCPSQNGRSLSLYAELLVRSIACQRFGLRNDQLMWRTSPSGKPYLDNIEGFHFSIAHKDGAIVAAVADSPVGIDIEPLAPIVPSIYRRCFSQAEQSYLLHTPADMHRRFYEIWTRKEAYVKYSGTGLPLSAHACAALDVCSTPFSSEGTDIGIACGKDPQVFFSTLQVSHYMISVCMAHPHRLNLVEITQQEANRLASSLETYK